VREVFGFFNRSQYKRLRKLSSLETVWLRLFSIFILISFSACGVRIRGLEGLTAASTSQKARVLSPGIELAANWTPQYGSLVNYWKFNSDLSDSVGGFNFGGGGSISTTNKSLGAGSCAIGTGIGKAGYNNGGQITISAWVFSPSTFTNYPRIVEKSSGWPSYDFIALIVPGNSPGCSFNAGANTYNIGGGATFDATSWHHVVCSYDGSTAFIMLDGVVIDSIPVTGALNNNYPNFYVGNDYWNFQNFAGGGIDDLAIWSKGLTPAEALTVYNGQAPH
jgi:hypothetical protein